MEQRQAPTHSSDPLLEADKAIKRNTTVPETKTTEQSWASGFIDSSSHLFWVFRCVLVSPVYDLHWWISGRTTELAHKLRSTLMTLRSWTATSPTNSGSRSDQTTAIDVRRFIHPFGAGFLLQPGNASSRCHLLMALRASDDDGLAAGSELLSFCELGQKSWSCLSLHNY